MVCVCVVGGGGGGGGVLWRIHALKLDIGGGGKCKKIGTIQ